MLKVVMKGDMGDRRPFRMEQGLATEYAICDNRWHRIHATYINDELTLRVDNLDQSYWLSDNGHLTEATTNSPLYIGGIPGEHLLILANLNTRQILYIFCHKIMEILSKSNIILTPIFLPFNQ